MGVRTPHPTLAQIFWSFLPKLQQNNARACIRSTSAPSQPPTLAIAGLKTLSLGHFWLRPCANPYDKNLSFFC